MARKARRSTVSTRPDVLIGYRRVSTREQAQSGAGMGAQTLAITREAEFKGWTIHWVDDDGFSGKDMKRDGLQQALDMLESGQARGMVVSKLDRLSRSLLDFASILALATEQGWNVVALDVGLDMSTPMGELMAGILAVFAQWERRVIGQRTKEGLAAKREQGVVLGRPKVVTRELLERVAVVFTADQTYAGTARRLNRLQVPTATGRGLWYPDSVRRLLLSPQGQEAMA